MWNLTPHHKSIIFSMMRTRAKLLTPRFSVLHLEEISHGTSFTSVKRFKDHIVAILKRQSACQAARLDKAEMYQRRVKGCGISQL